MSKFRPVCASENVLILRVCVCVHIWFADNISSMTDLAAMWMMAFTCVIIPLPLQIVSETLDKDP